MGKGTSFGRGLAVAACLIAIGGLAGAAGAQPANDLASSGLIGKIEGPQLLLDPAQSPKEFKEGGSVRRTEDTRYTPSHGA